MEATDSKKRGPNFTEQECLHLAGLLGEKSLITGDMTRHCFLKHKFTANITSKSKKLMWEEVATKFNASAETNRTSSELEKKWHNLVQKHRNLYADYRRKVSQTGGGPVMKTSLLTEVVMDIIGKENVSVIGVRSPTYRDTTFMDILREPSNSSGNEITEGVVPDTVHQTSTFRRSQPDNQCRKRSADHCEACCQMFQQVQSLKKQKLQLEIELLKRQLKEE